jgi:putative membrane protein
MQPMGNEELVAQLSLSDELAIEQTRLANDRTLLSFIRTSLYFAIAGLTISGLLEFSFDWFIVALFITIAFFLLIAGFIRYFRLRKKLRTGSFHPDQFRILMHDEE